MDLARRYCNRRRTRRPEAVAAAAANMGSEDPPDYHGYEQNRANERTLP